MQAKSFKTKILSYFILFCTIPLIISSSVILYQMYTTKQHSIFHTHIQILKQVEEETNSIILHIEDMGEYVKNNYTKKGHHILKGLPRVEKNISTVLILDNDGILVDFGSNVKTNIFKGLDYSNTKYFLAIKSGKENYWSKSFLSPVTSLPAISYTVRINKNRIAVLIINLDILNNFVKKFKSEDNKSIVRITDKNGIFLAHPDRPNFILEQKNILDSDIYRRYMSKGYTYKQLRFTNELGTDSIGIYGISKKLGWCIIVKEPYDALYKAFNSIIWFIVLFIVVLIIISIYVSIKLATSILLPLNVVGKRMEEIAHGKYSEDITHSDYVEIDKLSSNFLLMQKEIHRREKELENFNKTLEDEVNKKTYELQQINDLLEEKVQKEVEKNLEQEKKILESVKMVQMGEMIGNIAHQWRQPLSVISTSASGIKMKQEYGVLDEKDIGEYMDTIVKSTQFLSDTIDTFRDFIKEKKELKEIVIQQRVEATLNIISASLTNNNITMKTNIDNSKPVKLTMIAGELDQVIINIINNAKDALVEKKVVDAMIILEVLQDSHKVLISIEDNAGGIPNDILSKIFDPYFTTKHKSQGTGLGLSMSYKIITDSLKGKLYAKNTNLGAKFFIELPYNSKN